VHRYLVPSARRSFAFARAMSQQNTPSPAAADASNPNSKSAGPIILYIAVTFSNVSFDLAKKEAKRLEKEAKLAAKAANVTAVTRAGEKKVKAEKEKKEEEISFVNTTPKGEKKGEQNVCVVNRTVFNFSRSFPTHGQWLQSDRSGICVVRLVERSRLLQTSNKVGRNAKR
jgi:hypothetical protein